MLLLTWKVNLRLYRLPSFNVNHGPFGFPASGTRRKISGLPGDFIARLKILTSGSRVSIIPQRVKNVKTQISELLFESPYYLSTMDQYQ